MSHTLHLLHQIYHKCQENIYSHVTFLLPKIKSCVGASKMTQPVNELATKPNTNLSSIPRTCMAEGEKPSPTNSSDFPHSCPINKHLTEKKYSLDLGGSSVVEHLSSICKGLSSISITEGRKGTFCTSCSP